MSSIRNYNVAKHFQNYFSDVKVLTTTNRRWFPKEEFPFDEHHVFESPTIDYRTFSFSKKATGVNTMPNDSKSFFVKMKDSFPFNLIFGLGGLIYIFFGVLIGAYLVKRNKITHLFSSFKPYSDHVIAWWLKVLFPSLKWIADYNNLHIVPGEKKLLWMSLQKWFERKIASKADLLTTCSEGLVEHLEQYHDLVLVLEYGMMRYESLPKPKPREKFTISYTGSLYPDQSTEILFESLKQLIEEGKISKDKISVTYAGASSNLWNYYAKNKGMESISENLGVLPLDKANELQIDSQLNLLLTWRTKLLIGIIPSKFYDYLQSKRNILMIIKGGKDITWEKKFRQLGIESIFYDTPEFIPNIKSFVLHQYKLWEKGSSQFVEYPKEVFEGYYWDKLIANYYKELTSIGIVDKLHRQKS